MSKETIKKNIITLTFQSKVLMVKEVVKDEKGNPTGKFTGELVEGKNEDGSLQYERDDILALKQLLGIINVSALKLEDQKRYLMISEKINERWVAEDRNCEIEFNPMEISFLDKFLKDVKAMAGDIQGTGGTSFNGAAIQTSYHLKTKFSLLGQINGE